MLQIWTNPYRNLCPNSNLYYDMYVSSSTRICLIDIIDRVSSPWNLYGLLCHLPPTLWWHPLIEFSIVARHLLGPIAPFESHLGQHQGMQFCLVRSVLDGIDLVIAMDSTNNHGLGQAVRLPGAIGGEGRSQLRRGIMLWVCYRYVWMDYWIQE